MKKSASKAREADSLLPITASPRETDALLPITTGRSEYTTSTTTVIGGWVPRKPLATASFLTFCLCLALYLAFPTFSVIDKPYKHSQFLGFGINTGGSPDLTQCPSGTLGILGLGEEASKTCYLGWRDMKMDVSRRLKIMEDAIETAYNAADDSSSTLKIFVAPEFYWRGPEGAYDAMGLLQAGGEFNAISEICQKLTAIVSADKFKDWVFVFGTIIAATPKSFDNSTMTPEEVEKEGEWLFFNFAPIMSGGANPAKFLAPKEYVSYIDFLRPVEEGANEKLPWAFDVTDEDMAGKHHYDFDIWEKYSEYLEDRLGWSLVRRNFFELKGVRFSLEICLDHAAGEAKNNFIKKGGGVIDEIKPAQISLISSAGMTIMDANLILADKGVVYHQDGLYNRTSAAKVRSFKPTQTLNEKKHDMLLDATNSLFSIRPVLVEQEAFLWDGDKKIAKGELFSTFTYKETVLPKVNVFRKVKIAKL